MTRQGRSEGQSVGPPSGMPEGPPTSFAGTDYSFTMQMVGDLQKNVGQLIAKVEGLSGEIRTLDTRITDHGTKIDRINTKLAWATGAFAAVAVVVTLVWTVAQIIPWDRITITPEKAPVVEAPPAPVIPPANRQQ